MNFKIFAILLFTLNQVNGQPDNKPQQWFEYYIKNYGLDNKEYKNELNHFDYSKLFLKTSSTNIYGVIGDNMQRIRIKWISINKDPINSDNYNVYGKTKVNSTISDFTGSIRIKTIRLYKEGKYDMPDDIKTQPKMIGVLFCDYLLNENKSEQQTGLFKGISATEFYILNDTLSYNDLRNGADDMTNNQFVGEWIDYNNINSKICNWGDYRVPNVKELDCGAAEFAPCDTYIKNGWSDFYKAFIQNDSAAFKREKSEWWKL
jgi:hypothetical protein